MFWSPICDFIKLSSEQDRELKPIEYELQANGYCGKCDYKYVLVECEKKIYSGKPKAGYQLYCSECGAKVDFDNYYENTTPGEIAMHLQEVIAHIRINPEGYFNVEYIKSRIYMCKNAILSEFARFEDVMWRKECNVYALKELTRNLWDLMELLEKYEEDQEQKK